MGLQKIWVITSGHISYIFHQSVVCNVAVLDEDNRVAKSLEGYYQAISFVELVEDLFKLERRECF